MNEARDMGPGLNGAAPDNLRRLAGCLAHDFSHEGGRYRCRGCGGRVSPEAAHWFGEGLRAAERLERIAAEVRAAKRGEAQP